jgi:hypothetical protein
LDVEVKQLEKNNNWYERQIYQEQYAKLLFLKSKLEQLNFQINAQEKIIQNNKDDKISSSLLWQNKNILKTLELRIEKLENDLSELLKLLYNHRTTKDMWSETSDLSLKIDELLTIASVNTQISSEVQSTQKTDKMKEDNVPQDEVSEEKNLLEWSTWQIWNIKLDKDWNLISAENLIDWKKIYKEEDKDKIIWYSFEWIPYIDNIKPLQYSDNKVLSLGVQYWESYYYFNFNSNKDIYEQVEISWFNNSHKFWYINFDNNWFILRWIIYIGKWEKFFYKENWEYKLFLDWYNFYTIQNYKVNDEWKIVYIFGRKSYNGWVYIYLKDWKYQILDQINNRRGSHFQKLYVDENYVPVYWKYDWEEFILDTKTKQYRFKTMFTINPYKKRKDLIRIS